MTHKTVPYVALSVGAIAALAAVGVPAEVMHDHAKMFAWLDNNDLGPSAFSEEVQDELFDLQDAEGITGEDLIEAGDQQGSLAKALRNLTAAYGLGDDIGTDFDAI